MTEKQPVQADGGGHGSDADGVGEIDSHGKRGGGESVGGAYPNPHSGKEKGGFDGGQSERSYSGPDNPNATTD